MNDQRSHFKYLFKTNLQPFLEMLESKRKKIDSDRWRDKVTHLATAVAANPEQYIGPVMPAKFITEDLIVEIFEEFLRDNAIFEKIELHELEEN